MVLPQRRLSTTDMSAGQEFDLARQLGAPLGAYTTLGTYRYQRNFRNGSVFVNADVVSHNIDVNRASQPLAAASGVIVASSSPLTTHQLKSAVVRDSKRAIAQCLKKE